MVYLNRTKSKQKGFLSKIKVKFGKILAKKFPLNSMRILGLRLCGFKVGGKVYVGEDLIVISTLSKSGCNLKIGDRVAIAPRVTLILSSDANWSRLMDKIEPIRSTIILEDDCWLGTGVIIQPGITIGNCSIVGAGSVVTNNVPPHTVVAGIPARKINEVDL